MDKILEGGSICYIRREQDLNLWDQMSAVASKAPDGLRISEFIQNFGFSSLVWNYASFGSQNENCTMPKMLPPRYLILKSMPSCNLGKG